MILLLVIQKIVVPLHRKKEMKGAIAQMVEQRTENPCVPGSIPGGTTPPFISPVLERGRIFLLETIKVTRKGVSKNLVRIIVYIQFVKKLAGGWD